jgi:hypothetical protein
MTPLKLSISLTNIIVDRQTHLLSSLPVINVRMIQIPFTIEYNIKENNTKQTTETYNAIEDYELLTTPLKMTLLSAETHVGTRKH